MRHGQGSHGRDGCDWPNPAQPGCGTNPDTLRAFETAGHVEGAGKGWHRRAEFGEIACHLGLEDRWQVVGDDGREAGFQMVDEGRAPAKLADAVVAPGVQDRIIDGLALLDVALQFEAQLARHPLTQRDHLHPGDGDMAVVHELHVAQGLSGCLLDDVDRVRALDPES
jgi:hypothetical protein